MHAPSTRAEAAEARPLFGRTAPSREPAQMDLPLYPRGTLAEALCAYKAMKTRMEDISESTRNDYDEYFGWFVKQLGLGCSLRSVTFETLERLYHKSRPALMGITIKKRYKHLVAAMKYAADRRIIHRDDVPNLPPIPNDGHPGERALELAEYKQLRLALDGRFRIFCDLVFWTGMHAKDIWRLKYSDLDPDFEWKDENGVAIWHGRYMRYNTKGRRTTVSTTPAWFPMQPEFREIAKDIVRDDWGRELLIVGRIGRVIKDWFDAAADRCGIEKVKPEKDLRRSFASMLNARGFSDSFIQFSQGHAGKPQFHNGIYTKSSQPTIDDRHYVRLTNDFLIGELKRHLSRRADTQK